MTRRLGQGTDNERERIIHRFQENLAPIRKIAGWTAEELGRKIGVTKQSINNLENGNSKMSLTQYFMIRKLLDDKMKDNPENMVLPKVLDLLLDGDEPLEGKEYDALKISIAAISTSVAIGVPAVALGGMLMGALGTLGVAVAFPVLGAVVAGLPIYKYFRTNGESNWIKSITGDSGTKGGDENGKNKN